MYNLYIVQRTQIYIEEEQAKLLDERAEATGRTRSALIRAAIDDYLAPGTEEARLARFRAALRAASGIAPYLEDGATYVEKLRANDVTRQEELERRRRG